MQFKFVFSFFVLLFFVNTIQAQDNTFADTNEETTIEASTLVTILADAGSHIFFTDPESKVCFIDFAEIDGYAKQLVVKKGEEIIIDEALWELPENTIYELDYEKYLSGEYQIELYTYATVIKKALNVK